MNYPMLHGSDDIRDTYVWLGGTTTEDWDWRKELIPYLDKSVVYYDPCIRPGDGLDWDESARANEVKAKEHARCHVYVIASGMKGCFTIEEITEAVMSHKDVCVAVLDYDNKFTPEMKKSLNARMERWEELGATSVNTLIAVARYVNDHKARNSVVVSDASVTPRKTADFMRIKASSHF